MIQPVEITTDHYRGLDKLDHRGRPGTPVIEPVEISAHHYTVSTCSTTGGANRVSTGSTTGTRNGGTAVDKLDHRGRPATAVIEPVEITTHHCKGLDGLDHCTRRVVPLSTNSTTGEGRRAGMFHVKHWMAFAPDTSWR
ncbi:hypothetical protein GCM10027052_22350 [Parafrigoribacterium mesophilum]